MRNPPPELGLGILLAASLSTNDICRIFKCGPNQAEEFRANAKSDLMVLQTQIAAARSVNARPS